MMVADRLSPSASQRGIYSRGTGFTLTSRAFILDRRGNRRRSVGGYRARRQSPEEISS